MGKVACDFHAKKKNGGKHQETCGACLDAYTASLKLEAEPEPEQTPEPPDQEEETDAQPD